MHKKRIRRKGIRQTPASDPTTQLHVIKLRFLITNSGLFLLNCLYLRCKASVFFWFRIMFGCLICGERVVLWLIKLQELDHLLGKWVINLQVYNWIVFKFIIISWVFVQLLSEYSLVIFVSGIDLVTYDLLVSHPLCLINLIAVILIRKFWCHTSLVKSG